ncbi:hypothetical protein C8R45DRAFT_1075375 [Mycena sanguinolenta]|nr:hypothetical protein C8R45DRAFT_1075375 [Mycena sanguinolenta]
MAARCFKGMGPSIPDRSAFVTFEPHLRIDPAVSVSATLKACNPTYMSGGVAPSASIGAYLRLFLLAFDANRRGLTSGLEMPEFGMGDKRSFGLPGFLVTQQSIWFEDGPSS